MLIVFIHNIDAPHTPDVFDNKETAIAYIKFWFEYENSLKPKRKEYMDSVYAELDKYAKSDEEECGNNRFSVRPFAAITLEEVKEVEAPYYLKNYH